MSFYDIGAAASQQVLGASDLLRMAFLWQGSGKNRYFLWCLWCFEISSCYPIGTTGLSEPEKGLWISWSIGGVAMSRNIRVSEPSAEMQIKIIRARDAIASQKPRIVRCPYCRHNSIIVFEDTRGHVQTKCKACGRETVFNVLEMRRLRRLQLKSWALI